VWGVGSSLKGEESVWGVGSSLKGEEVPAARATGERVSSRDRGIVTESSYFWGMKMLAFGFEMWYNICR